MTQLTLLPTCVLPGCALPTDTTGTPCPYCLALFEERPGGWELARTDAPVLTEEEIAARDAAVRAEYETRHTPERKANQRCWLCEERRTCTATSAGWECDACVELA